MEYIIHILMLFIAINFVLKLSFWKWWQSLVFIILFSLFILWAKQFAILQSKTQLRDFMMNVDALKNLAVIITIESSIHLFYSFIVLSNKFGTKGKKWLMAFHWYPGLLIFPVIFYFLTQAIFTFSGVSFNTITYLIALLVLLAIPLLRKGIKILIPETEFRLEIHFLVSLFVAFIGLLSTVNGNVTYAATEQKYNVKTLILAFSIFAFAFFIGYAWNKYKWQFLKKREKHKISK